MNRRIRNTSARYARLARSEIRTKTRRIQGQLWRWRLRNCHSPVYTTDYVSPFIDEWQLIFEPYLGLPSLRYLEVGTFEGRSLHWFLDFVLTDSNARAIVIDRFQRAATQARYEHNLALRHDRSKVTTLYGNSSSLWWDLPDDYYDLIYIDGGHWAGQVLIDAVMAWRKLAPEGILLFDDYEWRPDLALADRPRAAIDAFLELVTSQYTIVSSGYQLAIRKIET